jgi:hypothetical protein
MDKVSDDNALEKIKALLFSGRREEIELALLLAESNEIDLSAMEAGIKKILSVAKIQPRFREWADARMENLIYPLEIVLTLCIDEEAAPMTEMPGEMGLFRNLGIVELHSLGLLSLPSEIQHLRGLRSLSVKHNQLQKLPEEIGSLLRLKSLNLHDNLLTALPDSLQHLAALEVLELSKNPNLKEIPYWLSRLPSLKRLVLDKDVFFGELPAQLLPVPDSLSVEWERIKPKF